ncbi:50S ribosomal protein L5 [Candidatus Peribacteria bacterium RIFOXYC2_FULL_55_14]|nr:MAG: 50S ribosomal protein L5 [Candidatus Peribacteria bacterium GW2011_GWB1_54_5]KKW39743.1 MAG: 50S ribosomal protein L5 [Candidatus Peribacteria bacterium GW2011_GWC2_54_8]OGJ71733.1 MAG: 50S ribosomal protein L5 [Candidatus Peribacteria bacterium RIFOXYA1_FULL_56_14]OGJ73344.1 MAG: 50S ribosomal protein L5 [Candidatus Peribacteria bacterium RIFOXYA2_FULL_55_28]OGJ74526.1 MAG: 50S ribosomal protein L5 [Candidatus Peribacteria bacterium RIFOXYB1_FULL_54_35]OGJ77572.1 MAG: 50S ribosomal pr
MAYDSLHKRLRGPITKALEKELGIQNPHALPRLEKVVVNVGINKSKMDSQEMREYVAECLTKITGQKPVMTRARAAISNFKTKKGIVVGSVVTLRGQRMEQFLDRLLSYALPRIRDFRGLPRKLDGHGNYAIGIRDHSIFPEVPPADAKQIFGLQVQITTTAESDEEAFALLKEMGVPFRPEREKKKEEEEERKRREERVAREAVARERASSATAETAPDASGKTQETGGQKNDASIERKAKKPNT